MKNAPSFLGYSQLGAETTAHAKDYREQIDLSTDHPIRTPHQPLYKNLFAPTQWPSPSYMPNFKPVFSDYMRRMGDVATFFTSLIAEALGMPADAFDQFFDKDQAHKLKIVKYPDMKELGLEGEGQGVGPHKDSMLSSYLLQVSDHKGLQVQNTAGDWIDCPPIDGTLVVAMGQGMEALTAGVCASTTHRVLSPAPGTGARFSIPFFQGVSLDAEFDSLPVPEEMKELRRKVMARNGGRLDDVEFTFKKGKYKHLGEATLMNRIKSHPDVGERWYPDLLAKIREDQAQEKREKEAKEKETEGQPNIIASQPTAVEAH
jgi:isopenicillin N synthase-like dioxygenase